jgi:hypothetical protein
MDPPGHVRGSTRRPPPPPRRSKVSEPRDRRGEEGGPGSLTTDPHKEGHRVTPHTRRASSARLALARSSPGMTPTAIWPTWPVALSRDSLTGLYRPVYRCRVKPDLTHKAAPFSLARLAYLQSGRDRASFSLVRPVLPGTHATSQASPLVAISPKATPDITATFGTMASGRPGGW